MSKIDTFRQKLTNGGHRSNRFRAVVNFPTEIQSTFKTSAQDSFEFLAFDAPMPEQAMGIVKVNYKGRIVHFAGDIAEAGEWSCSVYNTTSFDIRNTLLQWRNMYMEADSVTGENLIPTADVTIEMLDKSDKVLQRGTLFNAWPTSIGQVDLKWDGDAGISTFTLKLQYDYIIEEPVQEQE